MSDILSALLDAGRSDTHEATSDTVRVSRTLLREAITEITVLRDKLDRIQLLVGKATIDLPLAQIRQTLRDNAALASKPSFLKDTAEGVTHPGPQILEDGAANVYGNRAGEPNGS